jgi:hypothetical protein
MSGRVDRIEGACHDLAGAEPVRTVGEAIFEQLSVREDDAELVVQLMKELGHIEGGRRGGFGAIVGDHQAPLGRRAGQEDSCGSGARQSVSAKILTDPPAVRTYCTFPSAIQL